ncbi:SIS domain-containing protein, partial [Streptococcus mutans]|nr:SIS domain-containing protein [Streptococcus mutans]
ADGKRSVVIADTDLIPEGFKVKHRQEASWRLSNPNIIRPVSARLTSKDLVLFISLNGETVALVDAARNCIKNKVKTILLSASESSSLAHLTSLQLIGFKTELSYFPDYEVHSRLPLSILSRILLDAYAASLN